MAEPGLLTGSFLSQATGRNQMMKIGFALTSIGSFFMVQYAFGYNQILLISAVMMFGAGLIYGTHPAYRTEIFPTRVRTMISAWTRTVSSIVQLIVFPLMPYCAEIIGWSFTYKLFITISAFLCFILLFNLPKPQPRAELEEIAK
jgi:MFS family permease